MQIGTTSMEANLQHLSKLQMQIPLTRNSPVGNFSDDTCAKIQNDTHARLVTSAWLLTTGNNHLPINGELVK